MRLRMLLLLILVMLPAVIGAESLTKLEKQYGVNQATVIQEAEIRWVRENVYIIYDWFERRNNYVSMTTDRKLTQMLKNEYTREKVGIDEANLTAYVEEVKEEKGLLYEKEKEEPSNPDPKEYGGIDEDEERFIEEGEAPRLISEKKKANCLRQNSMTVYDPFRRANKWVSWVSDDWLLKIIQTRSAVVPKECR